MKKYISVRLWRDLTDKHLYREGDLFPFDGREVPEARLTELETGRNRAGLAMIQRKPEEAKKPEPEKTEPAKKPVRKTAARRTAKS